MKMDSSKTISYCKQKKGKKGDNFYCYLKIMASMRVNEEKIGLKGFLRLEPFEAAQKHQIFSIQHFF